MNKLFAFILMFVLIFSAVGCSPNEFILRPDDPNTISNGGKPVSVSINNPSLGQKLVSAIVTKAMACPLTDGLEKTTVIKGLNLPEDTTMRLCDDYRNITGASIAFAVALEIPATIEPGMAGEITQGALISGGQVVAWVFLASALVLEAAKTLPQLASMQAQSAAVTTDVLRRPGSIWDLKVPPQEAIDDLANSGSHALSEHAIAKCILHVLKTRQDPVRVYFSIEAPDKGVNQPSVGFSWYLDKVLRDLKDNLGDCAGIDSILKTEYGRIYDYRNVRLFLAVGFNGTKYFTFSAYPVLEEIFNAKLCEWGYFLQLYPDLKPTACPRGY